jgi:DNA-binding CsgD family transcriptional regulator
VSGEAVVQLCAVGADGAIEEPTTWRLEIDGEAVVLTRRERRVAELVCGGLGRSVIAEMMQMSPKTFDTHRAHVMRKMRCANEVQLLRLAVKAGWVEL